MPKQSLARRKFKLRNDEKYNRKCQNCTRSLSFTEVDEYFQNKGREDVLEELNLGDQDDSCYFPGDSVNFKMTKRIRCPNCKEWIENIKLDVNAEG